MSVGTPVASARKTIQWSIKAVASCPDCKAVMITPADWPTGAACPKCFLIVNGPNSKP